jgi:hypothetical protein
MIPDAIRARLVASPFRPFSLRVVSGESFVVKHPELVSISPGGRRLILWVGDEQSVDLDVLLIESIQSSNGNGHRRKRST